MYTLGMLDLQFRQIFANNLIHYRKKVGLTQVELAERLNYTDKSISKWERGEGIPDAYILNEIALVLDIPIGYLVSIEKPKKLNRLTKSKYFVTLLSVGIAWIAFVIAYVALRLFLPEFERAWLVFVYLIPVASIIVLVLSSVWGTKVVWAVSVSTLIWSLTTSIFLTFLEINSIWLVFLIAIPLQIMTIIWFFFREILRKEGR